MFDDFLEFCTLDNSLFRHGLFWVFIFCVTFSYFIRFKLLEARENAIENEIINKYIESQNLRKSGSAGRKPAS